MSKQKKQSREFILQNAGQMSAAAMAAQLGMKERKVKKILEEEKINGRSKNALFSSLETNEGRRMVFFFLQGILALILFGVLIYSNSFHAPFLFDDHTSIVNNYLIRSFDQLSWYLHHGRERFMTYLTFSLNYQMSGIRVFPYHVFNFLIHALNALFVFGIALEVLKTPAEEGECSGQGLFPSKFEQGLFALFAAFIFISHPLQTQAVTYLAQRNASLATFFYLSTLLCYAIYRRTRQLVFYILSWLACFLAMLTKEISFTLPIALFLYELCFYTKKQDSWVRTFKWIFPYILILGLMYFLIYHQRVVADGLAARMMETQTISRTAYGLTQMNVLRTYLRLLFFPVRQNLDYDYPVSSHFFEWPTFPSAVFLISVFLFGVYLFRQGAKIPAFAIFWFFIALSVESSFIPIQDVIFEHRLYLPMLGFALVIPWCFWKFLRKNPFWMRIILISYLAVLGSLTFARNQVWGSEIRLWTDVIRKSPNKSRPVNNLGNAYLRIKDFENARRYLEKAITLDPNNMEAYVNLGNLYEKMKWEDKAIPMYEKALTFAPIISTPYVNLARMYTKKGRYTEAIDYFQKALKIDPHAVKAYNDLAGLYDKIGEPEKAMENYERAVTIDPTYQLAHRNLGVTYGQAGNHAKAIEHLRLATRLKPEDAAAHFNLGVAYISEGGIDLARAEVDALERLGASDDARRLQKLIDS